MSVFHFKHFDVCNEASSMKINTDGVLLGAAVSIDADARTVLDVGTGTGVIALMTAQRMDAMGIKDFQVTGIDIDRPSAEEASANFARSGWADHLQAVNVALKDYRPEAAIDLIVSNPPYFDNSLQAAGERRNTARHAECDGSLSFRELAAFAEGALSENGSLALILPADQERALTRCLKSFGLYPHSILRIRSTAKKEPARIIVQSRRERCGSACDGMLTIHEGNGWSDEYLALTHDFYPFA